MFFHFVISVIEYCIIIKCNDIFYFIQFFEKNTFIIKGGAILDTNN